MENTDFRKAEERESRRNQEMSQEIKELKSKRNAVILAHCYQRPEVQAVADVVGDSFALARSARDTDADVIVLAGVRFMAETAKILNPDKTVLLPEPEAGCPMADMATAEDVRAFREKNPDVIIVSYVNTLAEVKALSDICCTSANARQVVESLGPDADIMFLPDRNLGQYIAGKTGRAMQFWEGYCPTHQKLTVEDIEEARRAHPRAQVLVHPECSPEVVGSADYALGTQGMVNHVAAAAADEFIIGTEMGMLDRLRVLFPEKRFYLASPELICPNMKATTLAKVRNALLTLEPRVILPAGVEMGARQALERMMSVT